MQFFSVKSKGRYHQCYHSALQPATCHRPTCAGNARQNLVVVVGVEEIPRCAYGLELCLVVEVVVAPCAVVVVEPCAAVVVVVAPWAAVVVVVAVVLLLLLPLLGVVLLVVVDGLLWRLQASSSSG